MSKQEKKPLSRGAKRRRRRRRLLVLEVLLLIVLCGGLYVWSKVGMISFDDIKNVKTNEMDESTQKLLKGYTNVALFGIDNRSNGDFDTGRSDSIMIASINNDSKEVKLISVYRDTFLDVSEGRYRKATEGYMHGGAANSIAMLNKNLDLDIQQYVVVDFMALTEAIDAVGGVELDVTAAEANYMNKLYITQVAKVTGKQAKYVSAGYQTLDGVQATAYCRVRYTKGDDYRRAERQRTVVEQLVKKAKAASVSELNSLINAVFPNIKTSFSLPELISLAAAYKDYELVGTRGFPFERNTKNMGGSVGSVVVPCTLETNIRELYEYLFDDTTHTVSNTASYISSQIQAQSGMGEANAVKDEYISGEGSETVTDDTTQTGTDTTTTQ